jgi:hypothetical protein
LTGKLNCQLSPNELGVSPPAFVVLLPVNLYLEVLLSGTVTESFKGNSRKFDKQSDGGGMAYKNVKKRICKGDWCQKALVHSKGWLFVLF